MSDVDWEAIKRERADCRAKSKARRRQKMSPQHNVPGADNTRKISELQEKINTANAEIQGLEKHLEEETNKTEALAAIHTGQFVVGKDLLEGQQEFVEFLQWLAE